MRATRDSRVTNKKKTAFAKQFECFSIFQNRFVLQFFIYRKWFICFVVWLRFVPVIFINLKTLIHSIYYLLISVCVCVRVCMVGPCVFVLSVPFKFRHWIIHAENRHLRDTIVTELLVLYFFFGFFLLVSAVISVNWIMNEGLEHNREFKICANRHWKTVAFNLFWNWIHFFFSRCFCCKNEYKKNNFKNWSSFLIHLK